MGGKGRKQKKRKDIIMAWLKPYLETRADDEADRIWDQLKMHGEAKEWRKFGKVIQQKWKSTGHEVKASEVLYGHNCLTIWDRLKDIRGGTNSGGSSCSGTVSDDRDTQYSTANTTTPSETTGGNIVSTTHLNEGRANHSDTNEKNRTLSTMKPDGMKPKKNLSKQRKRKDKIMAWLKPYLETRADNEADQIWDQLKIHGDAKEWRKFGNVIRRKWKSAGHEFTASTCLDNAQHCLNIWNLLKDIRGGTNSRGSSCTGTVSDEGDTEHSTTNPTMPYETTGSNIISTTNLP